MVQDGIYVNQSDYDQSPKAVDSQVGTIKFHDVNDDKQITYGDDESGDKAEIGNPLPKFTFGLTNNFEYKNFDLTIVATVYKRYIDFLNRGERVVLKCCKRSKDCCEVQAVKSYNRWLFEKRNTLDKKEVS